MVSPKRWGCLWPATEWGETTNHSRRKGMKRLGTTRIMMKDFRFNHSIIPISVVSLLRFIFLDSGHKRGKKQVSLHNDRPELRSLLVPSGKRSLAMSVWIRGVNRSDWDIMWVSWRVSWNTIYDNDIFILHHITSWWNYFIYIYNIYIYKWYHFLLESFHFGYAVDPSFLSHEIMISVIPRVRPGDPSPTCLRQSGRRRARLNLRISNQAVYRSVYRYLYEIYMRFMR